MKITLLICGENKSGKTSLMKNLSETVDDVLSFKIKISDRTYNLNLLELDKKDSVKDLHSKVFVGFIYVIDSQSFKNLNLEFILNKKIELSKLNESFSSFLFFNYRNENEKLTPRHKKTLENFSSENEFFFLETNFLEKKKVFLIKKLLNLKLALMIEKNENLKEQIKKEKPKDDEKKIKTNNRYENFIEFSKNDSSIMDLEKEYNSRKQSIENILTPLISQSINCKLFSSQNKKEHNFSEIDNDFLKDYKLQKNFKKQKINFDKAFKQEYISENKISEKNLVKKVKKGEKRELDYKDFDDFLNNEKIVYQSTEYSTNNKISQNDNKIIFESIQLEEKEKNKNFLKFQSEINNRNKHQTAKKDKKELESLKKMIPKRENLVEANKNKNLDVLLSNEEINEDNYMSLESNQIHDIYNKIHHFSLNKNMRENLEEEKNVDSSFFSQRLYEEINYLTNSKLKNSFIENSKISNSNRSLNVKGLNNQNKNLMALFDDLVSKQNSLTSNFTEIDFLLKNLDENKKSTNFNDKIKNCDQLISLNQNMIKDLDSCLVNKKNCNNDLFKKKSVKKKQL